MAPWDQSASVGDSASGMFGFGGSTNLHALDPPDGPRPRVGSTAEDLADATGLGVAASPSALPSSDSLDDKLGLLLERIVERIEVLEEEQVKTTALLLQRIQILQDRHQQVDAMSDTLIRLFQGVAATLKDWLTSPADIPRRRRGRPKRVDAHSEAAATDEARTQVASVTKRGRGRPNRSHAESVAAPQLLPSAITSATAVASETAPATKKGPGRPKRIKVQEAGGETPKASVTTIPVKETVIKEAAHVEDIGESSQQQYVIEWRCLS